jgi:tol-pal system protein YbgF
MVERMKKLLLMTCLWVVAFAPRFAAAQMPSANEPDMSLGNPPIIETPLEPLAPAADIPTSLNPFQAANADANGDTGASAESRISAVEAKLAELAQRMTADRTLLMRQQMTRLRAIDQRLEEMALQIGELGVRSVSDTGTLNTALPTPVAAADPFADPAQAAGIRLRLSTIEENLRQVSGQTGELVQSLEKLMQQVETARQDNEFRFQQIEGTMGRAARDPDAVPSSEPEVLGQIRMASPVEKLDGPSAETGPTVALIGEGDLPVQTSIGEPRVRPSLNDPKKLYDRALADLRAGSYAGAQIDFEQMLVQFPAHKLAGNAQYWLGETFYVRRQFKQAAEAFLAGYTTYQQSTKAPDSLLKLGMTLAAMGEKKTSCDAFKELSVKFPQAPQAIAKRAQIEKTRVGCTS